VSKGFLIGSWHTDPAALAASSQPKKSAHARHVTQPCGATRPTGAAHCRRFAMEAAMLESSVAFSYPCGLLPAHLSLPPAMPGRRVSPGRVQFHQLPALTQQAIVAMFDDDKPIPGLDDPETVPEWSEQAVVELHWVLLRQLDRLPDPETPLEEKLDTLSWALTDPRLDERPFSFANCVRVVGTSPLSPTPYFGLVQIDEIRRWLRINARKWILATIERYPIWVQRLIREQPDLTARELSVNPQWINQQIKSHQDQAQADMFVDEGPQLAN
jgi:hypothetical protein